MSLFKRNIAKDYSKPTCFNIVYVVEKKPSKPKVKKQCEERTTNVVVKNLFRLMTQSNRD